MISGGGGVRGRIGWGGVGGVGSREEREKLEEWGKGSGGKWEE